MPTHQMESHGARPASVFISYSHADEQHRTVLDKHLRLLQRQGAVSVWHDRRITAGDEWRGEIHRELNHADVVLLLVSVDFLASDYCYDVELKRAMERHEAGEARVVPIYLRVCDAGSAPFGKLQGIPDPESPLAEARNPDRWWTEVVRGIRQALAR